MAMITKKYCEDRKAPFQVLWRENGKRYSRFFETEESRENFIELHSFLEKDHFEALLKMPNDTITDIARIEILRGEATFKDIWSFWAKHHQATELITLWNACDNYIRNMREIGKPESHVVRVRRILESLCDDYGDRFLESLTRKELENWLNSIPYGPNTKRNYKAIVRTAWSYFEQNEWIMKNIVTKLKSEKIIRGEVEILTVDDVEKLLRANETADPEICGLMAIGLFAGMRSSAISRIDYDELHFDTKSIHTPAHKTKIGRRHIIEGLPDNLWEWLKRTPQSAFEMCDRKFKKRREMAYRRAGLLINAMDVKRLAKQGITAEKNIQNLTRHSPETFQRYV
jgi:Site-specific recombinase XerD